MSVDVSGCLPSTFFSATPDAARGSSGFDNPVKLVATMQRLSAYAAQLKIDEAAARSLLRFPLLVWEDPGTLPAPTQGPRTVVGSKEIRRGLGEPAIYELRKAPDNSAGLTGITIGRTENNDIVIPDLSVSRLHGHFQRDALTGEWQVVDAESSNGTFVDKLKLRRDQVAVLRDGVELKFGNVKVRYLLPDSFVAYLKQKLNP